MAPYKFLKAIKYGLSFNKFGDGSSMRDYTYIDDIVDGIMGALKNDKIECEVYNLGNSKPVSLNEFIKICENVSGKKGIYNTVDNQLGDVPTTYADISKANTDLDYNPKVELKEGLNRLYESL